MPNLERRRRYQTADRTAQPDQGKPREPDIFVRLEQAVGAIHDSDTFRRYLDVQSRFPTYSPNNVVLILSQRPDATRVAGYATWRALDRQVRRGEKGIRIIVPMRRKENEEDTPEESRLFFGSAVVFDVSQTDGAPLPEVPVPILEGEAGGTLMESLLAWAGQEGVRVRLDRGELPRSAMGDYTPSEQSIRLAAAPMRQMVKTLAHELGHHVHLTRFGEESRVQEERETVAEAVAYVVCAAHGIDTGERSFSYIATWAEDGRALKAAMGTIQKVAAVIIEGINSAVGTATALGNDAQDVASQTVGVPRAS